MPQAPDNMREFESLLDIIKSLRGPEGCPWDREQNHRTLTRFALEEAFELAEAIDQDNEPGLIEELGDLLLQVVLHSEIARQESRFDIHDVIETISKKMVSRHPHVFASVKVSNSEEVLSNWNKIKSREKDKPQDHFGIPDALPSLIRAHKIGEKTRRHNFDWQEPKDVLLKIEEELAETKEAIASKDPKAISDEIGDLLFSVAQLARHLNCDPEQSLRECNRRFEKRFFTMRKLAEQAKLDFDSLKASQLESLWQQAKALVN